MNAAPKNKATTDQLINMDADQFKQAIGPLSGELYQLAFHIMGNRDDALDAVQDLMLHLWQKRDQLYAVVSLSAFSATSLRHLCISRLRQRQTNHFIMPDTETPDLADDPEKTCSERQLLSAQQLIDKLEEPTRSVMRLRYRAGLSTADISTSMGMSHANVRQILSRTLRNFRKIILK